MNIETKNIFLDNCTKAYKNNGDTTREGTRIIPNQALDDVRNRREDLLASL
jgi:hypothetical protein